MPLIHLDRFGDLPDRGPDVNRPAHVDVRERKKQSARVLKRRPNRIFNVEPVANEPDELRDVDYPEFAHSLAAMVLDRPLGDPEFFWRSAYFAFRWGRAAKRRAPEGLGT